MIRINLLPFRAARTKENVRRQISVFLLIVVLMVVAMIGVTITLNAEKNRSQERLTAIKAELGKYTEKAKEVDRLKKESKLLQKKIDIIAQLENVRKEPVVLFTALTEVVVPERMWLNTFTTTSGAINITGTALDEITVADFAKRLEISEVFTDVNIKFLKHGVEKKVAIKKFEVNCRVGVTKKNKDSITGKAIK